PPRAGFFIRPRRVRGFLFQQTRRLTTNAMRFLLYEDLRMKKGIPYSDRQLKRLEQKGAFTRRVPLAAWDSNGSALPSYEALTFRECQCAKTLWTGLGSKRNGGNDASASYLQQL